IYSELLCAKICLALEDRLSQRAWASVLSCSYLMCSGVSGGFLSRCPTPWFRDVSTRMGREPNERRCCCNQVSSPAVSSISEAYASYMAVLVCAIANTLLFSSGDQAASGRPRKKKVWAQVCCGRPARDGRGGNGLCWAIKSRQARMSTGILACPRCV